MLKQSSTPLGLSLLVSSIMVMLLMIPIHTPAQREEVEGKQKGGQGEKKRRGKMVMQKVKDQQEF